MRLIRLVGQGTVNTKRTARTEQLTRALAALSEEQRGQLLAASHLHPVPRRPRRGVRHRDGAVGDRCGGVAAARGPHHPDHLPSSKQAIALVRERGGAIGYVRVAFADGEAPAGTMGQRIGREAAATQFHADAPAAQIHEEIAPQDDDIVVRKTRVGPFGTTDLHDQLQSRGIDTLILAGISTSGVVLSAVRDGHDRDYRLIVLSDLCADREADVHAFLVERIFPRQAEVITSTELRGLLNRHDRTPGGG